MDAYTLAQRIRVKRDLLVMALHETVLYQLFHHSSDENVHGSMRFADLEIALTTTELRHSLFITLLMRVPTAAWLFMLQKLLSDN